MSIIPQVGLCEFKASLIYTVSSRTSNIWKEIWKEILYQWKERKQKDLSGHFLDEKAKTEKPTSLGQVPCDQEMEKLKLKPHPLPQLRPVIPAAQYLRVPTLPISQ